MVSDNDPWLPPGHAERLTVGTRVRVRLSGECGIGSIHGLREDGATGIVVGHDGVGLTNRIGHPYVVWFNQSFTAPLLRASYYAASELEPIESIAEHNARVWNERVVRDGQRGSVTDLGMIVVERQP